METKDNVMYGWAARASERLNVMVEASVAALMLVLVLDVWLGVVDRYLIHWQLPWPETFARYVMIWAAMLAVSSGVARRGHIGVSVVVMRLPRPVRRAVLICMDVLTLVLFVYITWFGIEFAIAGASRQAMIFGVSLAPFHAAIPVAAALSSIQLILVVVRDMGEHLDSPVFIEHVEEEVP